MTLRAQAALEEAEVVLGYRRYLEFVSGLLTDKEVISSGMRHEVERCRQAATWACRGRKVALVSSGDSGVYGMAGLVLELLAGGEFTPAPAIEIIPGVTAATAAAALLGAPLANDFAVISLSDLLTPWETIMARLTAVLAADLVVALYNPSSRRRNRLPEVTSLVRRYREAGTPVGVVQRAYRPEQNIILTTLEALPQLPLDMESVVIIGNNETRQWGSYLVTPRGYRW